MRSVLSDLRHGVRLLWRSPLFTVVASVSLALGIGANTAIFTVVNTLLLTPLPVREPERLVSIFTSDFSGPAFGGSSYPDALDFATGAPALSGIAAARIEALSLSEAGATERVHAEMVGPSYFDVLGLRAAAGRLPGAGESGAIVVSHRFWMRRFNGDPAMVGRAMVLNGQTFTVAGIMDAAYASSLRIVAADVWVSTADARRLSPTNDPTQSRGNRGWMLIGRLAPGATREQAQAQLTVQAARLHAAYPEQWTDVNRRGRRVTVLSERDSRLPPQASGPVSGFLGALLGIVGVVLLVACANVAGLLVARGAARRREMAVRLALGAGRTRLVRQLLTEGAALALLSGALGLIVARWTVDLLARLDPPTPVPLALDLPLDGRVLVFAMIAAVVSGVLFSLAPALHSTRVALLPVLRNDVAGAFAFRRLSLRNVLVVSQVALSFLLLVVGGLFMRSVQQAWRIDTGFDTRNVLTATIDPSMLRYPTARTRQIYEDVLERVRALPGVQSAAVARVVPLSLETGRRGMRPDEYQPRPGEDLEEPFNIVSPGYFETMGMRLVRGRDFTAADRDGAEPVIIVNEAFAGKYWPNRDPLGRRVGLGDAQAPPARVIGLAANAKYFSLAEDARATIFLPFLQHTTSEATLHVKARGGAGDVAPAVRAAIREVDAAVPIISLVSLEERTSLAVLPQRIAVRLLAAFGGLALLMAAMGLYGVLAQTVVQRTREIGIRLALGATRGSVVRLVAGQGAALTATGIGVGLAGAAAVGHLISSFLYGVSGLDPFAFALGLVILTAAALLAVWIPARRASAIDPAAALRYE